MDYPLDNQCVRMVYKNVTTCKRLKRKSHVFSFVLCYINAHDFALSCETGFFFIKSEALTIIFYALMQCTANNSEQV